MIASVAFRNFKALRATQLALGPFNLVVGPNGSGKSTLLQALQRLRTLARLPLAGAGPHDDSRPPIERAEIIYRFDRPFDGLEASVGCVSDVVCDTLQVTPLLKGEGSDDWAGLRERLLTMREYTFDHYAMAQLAARATAGELAPNGAHLAAVLAALADGHPAAFAALREDFVRWLPEYSDIVLLPAGDGLVGLELQLADEPVRVPADAASQGTLFALGLLALAHQPAPPAVVCIEEVDRGIHPRLLREVRDALYRLSHPQAYGIDRAPVQVLATTHSPFLLDLFRDHPEEVVIAHKEGRVAQFSRLIDRDDVEELLQEGSLGDMWFAGILGGVPPVAEGGRESQR